MIDHKQKVARWGALEVEARDEVIAGLRDSGLTYQDIARVLGVRARRVEATLGEITALHGRGLSLSEISARVGLPRSTVHVIAGTKQTLSTSRRTTVLAALSDMHGMQLDTLGWFLGMERNHVYSLVADLVRASEVFELKQVQPGEKWVVPTRITATRYLGWRPAEWQPPLMFAEHYRAVAQARVMLVGSDPKLWVSERTLRHRVQSAEAGPRAKQTTVSSGRDPKSGRPHIHDGRFLGVVENRHGWWALEVELSKKDPAAMDIALRGAIRAARDADTEAMVGVLYLCRTASVSDNVHDAAGRLPTEFSGLTLDLVIHDFDAYWSRWLKNYTARREAAKAASPNRRRRTLIHLTQQEAS
ncbi:helix-turn-helix domain-containing protein [Nocardia sp. NPDC058176]|uniref:helix-turn-helix domain-containing protein n=1 Tax=Nocardia sp. NPDC058176 TaxID=3346368 RepID=UPI0036DB42F9